MIRKTFLLVRIFVATVGLLLLTSLPDVHAAGRRTATLDGQVNPDAQVEALKEKVRHQLVMLPYYNVFDWLGADVQTDGTVTLMGEVVRPITKDDAEARVKGLSAATGVVNNIEVLPLSAMDNQLRVALYRKVFNYNSPLFRYGTQSVPPIHIIVKNGHVTLMGSVATQNDKDLAYMETQQVPGVFEVKNELQID
jgi:hyperosmotically inducible protein